MGLIERLTLAADPAAGPAKAKSPADVLRERIVRRAALELQNGDYVNLGEPWGNTAGL
jgi:3-oxoacid CoA-transferase